MKTKTIQVQLYIPTTLRLTLTSDEAEGAVEEFDVERVERTFVQPGLDAKTVFEYIDEDTYGHLLERLNSEDE